MYPVIFRLGPLTVHSYGVMLALGFLIGFFLSIRRARVEGIAPAKIANLLFIVLVSGLIGARILFVLLNLEHYLAHPLEAVMLHRGGLAFFGGFALAFPIGFAYLRKVNLNPWDTFDLIIPYVALGQSIVRIGCFLNGCCYGTPSGLPWAVSFPPLSAAYASFGFAPLHPAQLYQAVANFVIFLLCLKLYSRKLSSPPKAGWIASKGVPPYGGNFVSQNSLLPIKGNQIIPLNNPNPYRNLLKFRYFKRYDGEIFLVYFLLYAPSRFFIEFLRGDSITLGIGIGMGQIAALLIFIVSVVIYFLKARQVKVEKNIIDFH